MPADCFGKVDKNNSMTVIIAIVNKDKMGLFLLQRVNNVNTFLTAWYITFFPKRFAIIYLL